MVLLENDTRLTLSDETVLSFLVRNIAFLLVTHVITAAVTTIFLRRIAQKVSRGS